MSTPGQVVLDAAVLALEKAGVRAWELYLESGREETLELLEGELDTVETSVGASGLAIRVLIGKRLGFTSTTDFSPGGLERAVELARAGARVSDPDDALGFPTPAEAGTPPALDLVDPSFAALGRAEKIERARALERAAADADPRVRAVRKATLSESDGWGRLRNAHGLDVFERRTFLSGDVQVVAEADGDAQHGYDWDFAFRWAEVDFAAIGRRAARRAVDLLGGQPVPTGRYDAVLDAQVVAEILAALGASLLGESVRKGKSLLGGRLGQPVASPLVTIIDDPGDRRGVAARRFDGEGIASRPTELVSRGVLGALLYDRYEATLACRAGTPAASTASCDRSSYRDLPGSGTSNLALAAGDRSLAALLAEVGDGLYVTDLLGMHTADPVSGDFSVGATGRRVRGGALAEAVTEVAVAGNLLDLLGRVRGLGSELRFFGGYGAPPILCAGLDVAGS